ncbi:NADP-dependent phosphogluconate dehydrogenase [Pontivivens insulae]|uniref:6-phosphogluconate dehydrogenase, decarboxylating n=1 Tax=Pontivivens insulae TaxID=1639689 RepID=A0A2R8A7F4_9RHOB|nr:NADP-dependent phosphogluconate dehydrogenase [Pontivivens insulae]RED18061.1 6-phosphogluconate dehydrogenase (decarboxylating) [Pontivivens insulae]SPF27958.1 6-phosphogluconate dehydrogenase, NADP(+)-dependent, decarboxylating [Pontivivens insulae]
MSSSQIGLIGLGTMGSALALNIAEKGFFISVFNRTAAKTDAFMEEAGKLAERITPAHDLESFVHSLAEPRAIILMVPAGSATDEQIAALRPLLGDDDLIIDAGNANFRDTNRRMAELDQPFLGVGVSGGEEGARHGPAIMGGGKAEHWSRVAPILTAIAAKFEGEACATHLGAEGAGHFVKTVHNGIEYADMQLIAEVYGLMRDGLRLNPAQIAETFATWNEGPLQSYLVEISAKVAGATDTVSGKPMLDVILDAAGQKGTGRWTAIEAQHLGTPIPVIEAAIAARNMSARFEERREVATLFPADDRTIGSDALSLDLLEQALICGKILCYAQGFEMIAGASRAFEWDLNSAAVARNWRAGCIIRSAMLDEMAAAFEDAADRNLMRAPYFAAQIAQTHGALRNVVGLAAASGNPAPALGAALAYLDTMRLASGTANMIQGQRDFFGQHGFVRRDTGESDQHGSW